MKKYYHLNYDWTGGERALKYDNLIEFAAALDAAMEDKHIIQSSITFYTEEI